MEVIYLIFRFLIALNCLSRKIPVVTSAMNGVWCLQSSEQLRLMPKSSSNCRSRVYKLMVAIVSKQFLLPILQDDVIVKLTSDFL